MNWGGGGGGVEAVLYDPVCINRNGMVAEDGAPVYRSALKADRARVDEERVVGSGFWFENGLSNVLRYYHHKAG